MKNSPLRALPFLAIFVLCIYTLRQADLSFASTLSTSVSRQPRQLATLDEPSIKTIETMCQNFTANQTFSETQVNLARKFTKSLEKIRGGNPMVAIINYQNATNSSSNSTATLATTSAPDEDKKKAAAVDYGMTMIPIMGFMLTFFLLSFFFYVGFLSTCLSSGEKFCFCCKMGDLSKRKALFSVLSILLVTVVVGISVAGLYISDYFKEDTNSAICTMNSFLDDIEKGSLDVNWIGLRDANTTLATINSIVNDLMVQRDKLHTIKSDHDSMSNTLVTSYNKLENEKLLRVVQSTPELKYAPSLFIEAYGPPTKEKSTTYVIQHEIDVKYNQVQPGLGTLLESMDGLKDGPEVEIIKGAKDFSDVAYKGLQSAIKSADKYSDQVETTVSTAESGLRFTFMVLCAIPIFGIIWFILTSLLKIRIFFVLSCGWWLLITASLVGWALSLFLIPTNIALMESCGVLNKALVEPEFFNKTVMFLTEDSEDATTYLHTCFHGDGDILAATGFIALFFQSTVMIEQVAKVLTTTAFKPPTPPTPTDFISNLIIEIEAFKAGTKPDSQETIDDLKTLNQNSQSTSTCEPIKDVWALSCTDTSYTKLLSTHDAKFNVGEDTCIGFDQWMAGTSKSITDRYQALKEKNGCETEDDDQNSKTTKALVESFIENRKDLNSLVENVKDNLNHIDTTFGDYLGAVDEFPSVVTEIMADLTSININLFDETTGLLPKVKCSVIPKDLKAFHDNLCVGFIPTLFQLSVVMTLFSFLSSIAGCSLFCLTRSFIKTENKPDQSNGDESTENGLQINGDESATDKGIQMAFMVYNSETN